MPPGTSPEISVESLRRDGLVFAFSPKNYRLMSSSSSTYFAPKGCLSELQSSAPTPFGLTTYKTFPPVKVAVSIVAIAAEAVALNVERTSQTGRNNPGNTRFDYWEPK